MDITVENIADVEIPEDLQNAIFSKLEAKLPTYLTGKEFVVKPKSEYDTDLTTAASTAVNKAVGEESAKLYGSIDAMVAIALGETKPDKMKTNAWIEKLQTEGKLPLSDDAITKLRDKLKGSSSTKDTVIDELQNQLNKEKDEREKDKTLSVTQAVKQVVKNDLRVAPVHISADLKEADKIKAAKDTAVADLTEFFNTLYEGKRNEDGDVYFVKKGTDKPLMNATENRPMTPTEIVRANHPMHLAPAGHTQPGGGTGKSTPTPGGPGQWTSLSEIRQYAIKEKGFAVYSNEFDKFVSEERAKAKL